MGSHMSNLLFVLGSPDPEMVEIENLLRLAGEEFVYAAHEGRRVHGGNAYKADGILSALPPCPMCGGRGKATGLGGGSGYEGACHAAEPPPPSPLEGDRVLVECAGEGVTPLVPGSMRGEDEEWGEGVIPGVIVVDHHRKGDPGADCGPKDFLRGSSLGQVARLLGIDVIMVGSAPTLVFPSSAPWAEEALNAGALLLAAAGDHCPGAAYRGECPGVDPDELGRWRAATRAAFQGQPFSAVLADVETARRCLRAAEAENLLDGGPCPLDKNCQCGREQCELLSHWIRDLRSGPPTNAQGACVRCGLPRHHAGADGYTTGLCSCPPVIPELPEAALREGVAYLATVTDPDGREKVVLGAASSEEVRGFMEVWAPAQGLIDIYGAPKRGFSGGYLTEG